MSSSLTATATWRGLIVKLLKRSLEREKCFSPKTLAYNTEVYGFLHRA